MGKITIKTIPKRNPVTIGRLCHRFKMTDSRTLRLTKIVDMTIRLEKHWNKYHQRIISGYKDPVHHEEKRVRRYNPAYFKYRHLVYRSQ